MEQRICYGKEVNDFHTLNKQKLFALNFSATQEIDRIQQAEKTKLAETEIKLAETETKLAAAEAEITTLKSQLECFITIRCSRKCIISLKKIII